MYTQILVPLVVFWTLTALAGCAAHDAPSSGDTPSSVEPPLADLPPIRIVLVGDSTVANSPAPNAGWGQVFGQQLRGNVELVNPRGRGPEFQELHRAGALGRGAGRQGGLHLHPVRPQRRARP